MTNRGLSKRAFFEDIADMRYFRSRVARAIRRGEIEVDRFVFMTTHFHMLLLSLDGNLSGSMRRIQNEYVRWFNRRHARDGSLVRGRFWSRPVLCDEYRRALIRYIDNNPVKAGIVRSGAQYAHGSAQYFAGERPFPPWLARNGRDVSTEDPAPGTAPATAIAAWKRLVETRFASGSRGADPLKSLIHAAPPRVRRWMESKARLADGTRVGLPVADPITVLERLAAAVETNGEWTVRRGRRSRSAWDIARVALLRDLAAASWVSIGKVCGRSHGWAPIVYHAHQDLMADDDYATRIAALAHACIGTYRGV